MEKYPIPQFIEAEGKIAFFISFRQFFYLVGAGVICFFIYFLFPKSIFYIAMPVISILAVIFAFVRINGSPVVDVIFQAVGFSLGGKNYIWKKKEYPYPFKSIKRTQIKKIEHAPVLQAQTSQLKKIRTSIELKTK